VSDSYRNGPPDPHPLSVISRKEFFSLPFEGLYFPPIIFLSHPCPITVPTFFNKKIFFLSRYSRGEGDDPILSNYISFLLLFPIKVAPLWASTISARPLLYCTLEPVAM